MEEEKKEPQVESEEVMPELTEGSLVNEEVFSEEISDEEFLRLSPESAARYSVCHPTRCPRAGQPMPHPGHVPLYPNDWC